MKSLLYVFLFLFLSPPLCAQKVGLVLSGGGGLGLAHIGVLKCLDEYGIKVDYIVGTSAGGLVGGFYAAGYSAKEIEQLVISEEFQQGVSGTIMPKDRFLLGQAEDDASWISVDLELDTLFHALLNPVLVNDIPLNFGLARHLYLPSMRAGFDFDKLPIPFRCIASDILMQKSVVIKSGQLSDAIRATITVPMFFTPIKVANKYLFDGGIYNNFGVDVMREEFKPDVIIGVNVATTSYADYPYGEDDELVKNPVKYALIANGDTTQLTANDILILPDVPYNATKFDRVKEKVKIGYEATKAKIEEIKRKIRKQKDDVQAVSNYKLFTDMRETNISKFTVTGIDANKSRYVERMFKIKKDHHLSIAEIRRRYFRLASYPYFQSIYPRFLPDEKGCYEFNLAVKDKSIFKILGGGNLSTRGISMIYGGVNFNFLRQKLYSVAFNAYAGSFYASIQGKVQINYPYRVPFYVEPQLTYNNWNYIQASELFIPATSFKTNVQRTDRFLGVNIGLGIGNTTKTIFSVGYISNHDDYTNTSTSQSSDTLDVSTLKGLQLRLQWGRSTLNRKQFASIGSAEHVSVMYFNGQEEHFAGNTSVFSRNGTQEYTAYHQWFRIKATTERYIGTGKYQWGYMLEGVFSNQPTFRNYRSSLINAPAFYPLLDSRTIFLSDFRAFSYVAGGLRNVITLAKRLDLRLEGYVFKPFNKIVEGDKQNPILGNMNFKDYNIALSGALVYHSPLGPASLNLNYYDDVRYKWGFFLNVGLLIFNKRAMEE
jgi:NTE family protein